MCFTVSIYGIEPKVLKVAVAAIIHFMYDLYEEPTPAKSRPQTLGTSPLSPGQTDSQVFASQHKWLAKQNASQTQVENLRQLASLFGQGFTLFKLAVPR